MYEVNNKSTMHGVRAKYGKNTPHKMPTDGESLTDTFKGLITKLYPTGRAFYMKKGGEFDLIHEAINRTFIRLSLDGKSTINSILPDNDDFNILDAELLEYKLGLSLDPSLTLEERKKAILTKLSNSNTRARQTKEYIESVLQSAGFNVYVHENTPPYKTPGEVSNISLENVQHSNNTYHGDSTVHGSSTYDVIANYSSDEVFSVGPNLWATFFIGGQNLGDMAVIPLNRKKEFKELVLKLKPAHLVAYIFINFI